jgi:hypothetical protein
MPRVGTGLYDGDQVEEKFATTHTTACDSCLSLSTLASFIETTIDGSNGLVYCVPTTTTTTTTLRTRISSSIDEKVT